MLYLSYITFPDAERETSYLMGIKRTCYSSFYPFRILSRHRLSRLDFEPVTILYGGNGSGKTTALNVIAEKVKLKRDSLYNRSNFFEDYIAMCDCGLNRALSQESRIITSDDVFDFMLDLRTMNQGIDRRREELFEEYLDAKYSRFQMRSLEDYDLKRLFF